MLLKVQQLNFNSQKHKARVLKSFTARRIDPPGGDLPTGFLLGAKAFHSQMHLFTEISKEMVSTAGPFTRSILK